MAKLRHKTKFTEHLLEFGLPSYQENLLVVLIEFCLRNTLSSLLSMQKLFDLITTISPPQDKIIMNLNIHRSQGNEHKKKGEE